MQKTEKKSSKLLYYANAVSKMQKYKFFTDTSHIIITNSPEGLYQTAWRVGLGKVTEMVRGNPKS